MFILSVGMPKSGSTLFSLYQQGILERSGVINGQVEFEKLVKEGTINGIGIFVYNLESPETINKLVNLSEEIGPFVVKAHSNLTIDIKEGILNKQILATYIHRDPRDVILSAIDHGTRPLNHPTMNSFFLQFDSILNSIPIVKTFCGTGIEWIRSGLCETFKYHDLLVSPAREITRFSKLIHSKLDDSIIRDLINTYADNPIRGKKQYNTGKLLRYPDEMSHQEIEICNREMAEEIEYLGYQ